MKSIVVSRALAAACICLAGSLAVAGVRTQTSRMEVLCTTQLKQVGLATAIYCADYDEKFPYSSNPAKVQEMLYPYTKDKSYFTCPQSNKPFLFNKALFRNPAVSLQKHLKAMPATVAAYDPKAHANKSWGVVFGDGHAKRFKRLPSLALK